MIGQGSRVVVVHGIGHQFTGPFSLRDAWLPPVKDGLRNAGSTVPIADGDVAVAHYGDLFRGRGATLGDDLPLFLPQDVPSGFESDLLHAWARSADSGKVSLGAASRVQEALNRLLGLPFFKGVAQNALIFMIRQVGRYFNDPVLRRRARERVCQEIGPGTRLIVAHSLGSVVAYEALFDAAATPFHQPPHLVTLGSPLAVRSLVFDRLEPKPDGKRGAWPDPVAKWTNVTSPLDVVALGKRLRTCFGERVHDVSIDNGFVHVHNVDRYLSDAQTGRAVDAALRSGRV